MEALRTLARHAGYPYRTTNSPKYERISLASPHSSTGDDHAIIFLPVESKEQRAIGMQIDRAGRVTSAGRADSREAW